MAGSPAAARSPFVGDSGMARMMREFDWAASALGPVSGWPESLCTAVSICLTSRHPMVVWWGPELVPLYNDAWTPILGDRHPEGLGRRGADVWPEMWHFIGAQMRSVLATGQATWSDDQLLPTSRSGFLEEAYFTYSFSPVHDHTGAVGGVFTAVTETTGRVLGERRMKVLGALGEISAVSAPTIEEACVAATEVLGGARADVPFGVIYLLDEIGSGARQAASFGMVDDPERVPTALTRGAGHPTLWRVLATGQPVVLTGVSANYPGCFGPAGGPMGPADPELAVGMPLPDSGGRPLGVLFAGASPFLVLDEEYRRFLDLVARQVGAAITDARSLQAQRDIAQTLQHSLLPARVPDLARLAIATSYRPAGRYSQAGGDWYDIIPLDADQVAIAVGDVVGSGTTAAAVMGQLRSALAAALIGFRSPSRALELLSRYTERVEGAVASTALCLVVNTRTGVLRWAAAGHPPPVLLDPRGPVDGATFLRGGRGPVLGHHRAPGALTYPEATATMAPGCTVVLYTDGLVERRGEHVDRSLDRLLQVLGPAASAPIGGLLDLVQSRLLGAREPADDVAIVAARLMPAPLRARLPATPEQLAGIRGRVRRWADEAGLSKRSVQDLQLALGEALANSIEHAYPPDAPGELGYRIEHAGRGAFGVEVVDEGRWRSRSVVDSTRGRGLFMIRALADDVVVDGTDRGTTVRFTVRDPVVEPDAVTALPVAAPGPRDSVAPAGLRIETRPGDHTVLWLTGDLDLDGTEALRPELVEQLSRHPGPVRLDVSEVSYLGSAGIRLIGEVTGRDPGRIEVHAATGSRAARVLRMAGL